MERFEPLSNRSPESDPLKSPDIIEPPVKDFSKFVINDSNNSASPALKTAKKSPKLRSVIIVVVIAAILGVGAYIVIYKPHQPASGVPKTSKTTKSTTAKSATSSSANTPKAATTSYTSSNFNLGLNYPKTWDVASDTATSLIIESPQMQITTASSKTITGKVLVTVQPSGQLPSAFGASDATAVSDSERIVYAQPTSNQRAQTYLSFVQYAATTTSGALDALYITGDYGYQRAQTIPRTDIKALNPLVTVTFGGCADAKCTSLSAVNIKSSSWSDASFSAPILTILQSLAFS